MRTMGTSEINCPMTSPSMQKDCLQNVMSYLGSKKDLFIFILNGFRTNTGVTNVIVEKRRIVQNIKLIKYLQTVWVRLRYEYKDKPQAGVRHLVFKEIRLG